MGVLPAIYVNHVCLPCILAVTADRNEGTGAPGSGAIVGVLDLSPLEEEQALLTAETFFSRQKLKL